MELLPYPEEGKGVGFFLPLSWRSKASSLKGTARCLARDAVASLDFVYVSNAHSRSVYSCCVKA